MPDITFDKFSSGLDRRKSRDTAGADALYELTNAHVDAGHEITKRDCAATYTTLEPGSVGLFSALGGLHTFTDDYTLVHGAALVTANHVPHPTATSALTRIHYCEPFQGYLYVVAEYANGDIYHHYLDAGSSSSTPKWASPAWEAATAYATTSPHYVTPTTPNGFRYECTTGGTSGGTEPTWPTTIGGTVNDNGVVWTCRSFVVTDTNCPQTVSVAKVKSKLFSIDGDVVRFCATAVARDWTTGSDAGFLATGASQDGSNNATAVGNFKRDLAVFFTDAVQIWTADPDPSNIVLSDIAPNVGCRWPRTPGQVSQDTVFLSDQGFRSLSLSSQTDQLEDSDIGAPIDEIVRPLISDLTYPYTEWYSHGQLWTVMGSTVFSFTWSRTSKVSAWSKYAFPFTVDYAANYSGRMYLRNGDDLYVVQEGVHQDDVTSPQVVVEFPFLDCKKPGELKAFHGVDFVGKGTVSISFKYRSVDLSGNPTEGETDTITLTDNSMPGVMTPIELCATAIAPRIVHQANEAFRLSRLTLYYDAIGPL